MGRLGMFMNDYYRYIMHGIILVLSILVFVFINIYMYGAVKNAYRMARLQLVSAMKREKCILIQLPVPAAWKAGSHILLAWQSDTNGVPYI